MQVRSLTQEDPLEEEMAAHSSILAWKIPRAEEPGRLQSKELQRVGHDWVTKHTPELGLKPDMILITYFLFSLSMYKSIHTHTYTHILLLGSWCLNCMCFSAKKKALNFSRKKGSWGGWEDSGRAVRWSRRSCWTEIEKMVPFSNNSQPALSFLKDSGSAPSVVLLSPVLGCSLPLTHSKWLCILTQASGQAVILVDKTRAQKGQKIHILQPGEDLPPGNLGGLWQRQNL